MRKNWYTIKAAHGDTPEAEILIYDEIGKNFWGEGTSAEQLVRDLAEIDADTINVRINSSGGSVFEGLAIHNALERHPAKVVTHVDGLAASIASVVALAGDEVRIAENAFVMIHDPWGGQVGNSRDMRSMADTLDKVGGSLVGVYAKKTGASEDQIAAWMADETWFNAADASSIGLVDTVTEAKKVKASGDLSRFTNVPESLSASWRHSTHRTPSPS